LGPILKELPDKFQLPMIALNYYTFNIHLTFTLKSYIRYPSGGIVKEVGASSLEEDIRLFLPVLGANIRQEPEIQGKGI